MEDCVFCKIVSGTFGSAKIWEDDQVLAFLDIKPLTKGHALIIPKQHVKDIFDLDPELLKKIAVTAQRISLAIKKSLQADGIRLSQSNGKAAGQEIFHFHLHVIPRYANDGISMSEVMTAHPDLVSIEDLGVLSKKITGALS